MGIEAIAFSVLREHNNPNPLTMKFAIALLALAALASATPTGEKGAVKGAPAVGKWGDNKFFAGTLDNIQGALEDVKNAGRLGCEGGPTCSLGTRFYEDHER